MRYCTQCGTALNDEAAFCSECGARAAGAPGSGAENIPGAPADEPGCNASSFDGEQASSAPPGRFRHNTSQSAGLSRGKRALIAAICTLAALCLIAGGVLMFVKLYKSARDALSGPTVPASGEASPEGSAAPSASDALAAFAPETRDEIASAFQEIGLDAGRIEGLEPYGEWHSGTVFTFNYGGTVVDMLLYDDGTLFSIETGGVQLYLRGYESYQIDDHLGSTEHYDESYPESGYAFYINGLEPDSTLTVETSPDFDYVVELIDIDTSELAIAFYVRAGEVYSMAVPSGNYIVHYAAGNTWYGTADMFGPYTLFFESADVYSVPPGGEASVALDAAGSSGIPAFEIDGEYF